MPYSTACHTPLANFEAKLNYKDIIDPAGVCVREREREREKQKDGWGEREKEKKRKRKRGYRYMQR